MCSKFMLPILNLYHLTPQVALLTGRAGCHRFLLGDGIWCSFLIFVLMWHFCNIIQKYALLAWNQLSSSQIKKPSFVFSIRKGNKTIQALLQAIGQDLRKTREIVSVYVHFYVSPCHAIFNAGWHLSGSLAPLPVFLECWAKDINLAH